MFSMLLIDKLASFNASTGSFRGRCGGVAHSGLGVKGLRSKFKFRSILQNVAFNTRNSKLKSFANSRIIYR
jgi:hypothetical protein